MSTLIYNITQLCLGEAANMESWENDDAVFVMIRSNGNVVTISGTQEEFDTFINTLGAALESPSNRRVKDAPEKVTQDNEG